MYLHRVTTTHNHKATYAYLCVSYWRTEIKITSECNSLYVKIENIFSFES
uniref:Uncharacterized protein n=1 Tax=Anguilla anguilla TaxID=7936 RepID=A0A0E9SP12_ANGAN